MKIALYLALAGLAIVVGYLLDRFGLFLEERGYIYYRKKGPSSTSLGNAFLNVQSMVDPAAQHVLEIQQGEQEEQDDSGDPPEPAFRDSRDRPNELRASEPRDD